MRFNLRIWRLQLWHLMIVLAVGLLVFLNFMFKIHPNFFNAKKQHEEYVSHMRTQLRNKLGDAFSKNEFPEQVEIEDSGELHKLKVNYTIDETIQTAAQKLLKAYKPDYAAIVAMDAKTGRILAMTSYLKEAGDPVNLATKATYPAASVFKIVPASAALDKYNLDPEMMVHFNGGSHTLYKRNVMSDNVNKWTRFITLKEAFARSINTVFARLTFEKLSPLDLKEYVNKYHFNQAIDTDFPVEISTAFIPDDKSYELAEIASGYNRVNKLSPIQGAMMAASIADEGIMRKPYLVESLTEDNGKTFFKPDPEEISRTLTISGSEKVRELMSATIHQGTGRKSFRTLVRNSRFTTLEVGGKTGSLMGDEPKGKVDWFVGYGIRGDEKISVAAITVNKQFWTVKAAYLAQTLFKEHFKEEIVRMPSGHPAKKITNAAR